MNKNLCWWIIKLSNCLCASLNKKTKYLKEYYWLQLCLCIVTNCLFYFHCSGYSGFTSASQQVPGGGLPAAHNQNSNNYLPPPYSYVNDAVSYQSLNRPPPNHGLPSAPSLHSSGKDNFTSTIIIPSLTQTMCVKLNYYNESLSPI